MAEGGDTVALHRVVEEALQVERRRLIPLVPLSQLTVSMNLARPRLVRSASQQVSKSATLVVRTTSLNSKAARPHRSKTASRYNASTTTRPPDPPTALMTITDFLLTPLPGHPRRPSPELDRPRPADRRDSLRPHMQRSHEIALDDARKHRLKEGHFSLGRRRVVVRALVVEERQTRARAGASTKAARVGVVVPWFPERRGAKVPKEEFAVLAYTAEAVSSPAGPHGWVEGYARYETSVALAPGYEAGFARRVDRHEVVLAADCYEARV